MEFSTISQFISDTFDEKLNFYERPNPWTGYHLSKCRFQTLHFVMHHSDAFSFSQGLVNTKMPIISDKAFTLCFTTTPNAISFALTS